MRALGIVIAALLAGCVINPDRTEPPRADIERYGIHSPPYLGMLTERRCAEELGGDWLRREDGVWICEVHGWEFR